MRNAQLPQAALAIETARAVREAIKPWPARAAVGFIGGGILGLIIGGSFGLFSGQHRR